MQEEQERITFLCVCKYICTEHDAGSRFCNSCEKTDPVLSRAKQITSHSQVGGIIPDVRSFRKRDAETTLVHNEKFVTKRRNVLCYVSVYN